MAERDDIIKERIRIMCKRLQTIFNPVQEIVDLVRSSYGGIECLQIGKEGALMMKWGFKGVILELGHFVTRFLKDCGSLCDRGRRQGDKYGPFVDG